MENLKQKIQEAVNLYKSGSLIKCEKFTKNLIKMNPEVVFLHNLLGMVLSAQGRTEEAVKSYKKGIEIDPNFAIIYNNLALIYYNRRSVGQNFQSSIEKAEISSNKFSELVEKIIKKNSFRTYPDINDIPN